MSREFGELVGELTDEQWAGLVARVEREHTVELAEEKAEFEDEHFFDDCEDDLD